MAFTPSCRYRSTICTPITTCAANHNQNFNLALKLQPQAFAGLTLITWGQTLYYHKLCPSAQRDPVHELTTHSKWKAWTATVATIALAISFAVTELILILTLRVSELHQNRFAKISPPSSSQHGANASLPPGTVQQRRRLADDAHGHYRIRYSSHWAHSAVF